MLGESCSLLGSVLADQNKLAEAAPLLKRSREILEKTNDPRLCYALLFSSTLYKKQGKLSEAEASAKKAIGLGEKFWGPNDPKMCQFLGGLAGLYKSQGKKAEAKKLEDRIQKIRNQSVR